MAVDFALSETQAAIADAFGSFFTNECDIEVVRAAEPLGYSPELWAKLQTMEAPGMAASEANGGSGATMSDLVVVAEAYGAALAPVPLIEHWVASRLLSDADVISGDRIATVAVRPADADGVFRMVPAGAIADVVVGVHGNETVAVSAAPSLASSENHGSSPIADRSATEGERVVLGDASLFDGALNEWRLLTGAALTGIADSSLKIAVEYVLEREQFGRPIGSFQAIQHGLAEFPAAIDGARFLAHKAAWAFDKGFVDGAGTIDMDEGNITEFAPLAAMAFIQGAEAAGTCSDRSLHYHGGYGFSLEYDIQLFFRRARSWANIIGDPARQRLVLADLLWPSSSSDEKGSN